MVVAGDVYDIQEATETALKNSKPLEVLGDLVTGLHQVGEAFQRGEFFIADVMCAADTFKDAMKILKPLLGATKRDVLGKVVLGTVQGDIHDIGKNLVAVMFEGAGFEVVDIGIDVPPEKFVEAVKVHHPQIVAMSALISTTMLNMAKTIEALEAAGLRKQVKILVGGAPVSERYAQIIGADAFAVDALSAVNDAIRLIK